MYLVMSFTQSILSSLTKEDSAPESRVTSCDLMFYAGTKVTHPSRTVTGTDYTCVFVSPSQLMLLYKVHPRIGHCLQCQGSQIPINFIFEIKKGSFIEK